MTPGGYRNLVRATEALREAETLVDMSHVSGPADEPPKSEAEEKTWAEDWRDRALHALQRAKEIALGPATYAKERAKRIVQRIASGVTSIRRATGQRLKETLKPVTNALQTAQLGLLGFEGLVTFGILYLAYKYFFGKGAHAS